MAFAICFYFLLFYSLSMSFCMFVLCLLIVYLYHFAFFVLSVAYESGGLRGIGGWGGLFRMG